MAAPLLFGVSRPVYELPKIWRRTKVIALPKPNKPLDDPKGYRPIALLCVPYKLMERLLHARPDPVIDSQLPNDIREKAGVVLLDLSAAYDTVWHRGLHLKLLQTIPDRHMVNFIMEMMKNRSFTLNTSDGQCSRLRWLKNGVPQGSVLVPMLFNIYIHDLPVTQSKKYGYADDLAILLRNKRWEEIEAGLTADMTTLSTYLRDWRLKLSVTKTTLCVFHLNNREASRELNVMVNNKRLQSHTAPSYLGVLVALFLYIGREGVAREVYQNRSHECITRKPRVTPSYN